MKLIRLIFILPLLAVAAAPVMAQISEADLARIDQEVTVMVATLARLNASMTALDRAINDPETMVWMTEEGWSAATINELSDKVAFLQMAATRPDARDRTERIAGMELPTALAEIARESTGRPARRLVREWADREGPTSRKAAAAHQQGLKRTIKMTESWLAEHRAVQQAARQPAARTAASARGNCYVEAGRWRVGSTQEILEITSDYLITARKTKGSRNVPAGEIAFYVHPWTCDAGMQTAEEGFVDPTWVRSRIAVRWIEPERQFSIEWPERSAVTYTKVD